MNHLIITLSIFFLFSSTLSASDTTKLRSIFDDFYHPDQIVDITLQFDCKKLIRQKEKREEFPATISYQRPDGSTVKRTMEVKTRGKLRLNVCTFPPLKLDFNKEVLKKENFNAAFDDLKMVTHCLNQKNNTQQVIKEFLVYQLYNIISEYSLRAQLLHVKYLDAEGQLYADEYGMLLENEEAMAYRNNCSKSEKIIESIAELQPAIYNKMVLFEYMIGNVDWNIRAQHNITFIKSLKEGFRIGVPYDFDYSGVVNATYAVPDERVGQKYLGERVIVSHFTDEEGMRSAVQYFLEKEAIMMQTCNNITILPEEERKNIIKYLTSFFEMIKNPKLRMNHFTYHIDNR